MNELKKRVLNEISELNGEWADLIKEAETGGEISVSDVASMTQKLSKRLANVDAAFNECQVRMTKKKGIFG